MTFLIPNNICRTSLFFLQTQVKKYADVCGLNQFAWPLDTKLVKGRYDVGVLASFGHLIPKTLVEAFP